MSKHLKRLAAPRIWKIPRKEYPFAPKPSPGPHPADRSLPLLIILRDVLQVADNKREVKKILSSRLVKIDGRVIRDIKFPVGFMDVITVGNTNYRALYDVNGRITLVEIPEDNARWKLVRIENKRMLKGGKIQLNLHDGRNILLGENKYSTGDVLKINVPSQEIIEHYPLSEGSVAMVIGGKHRGKLAHIKEYRITRSPNENVVVFEEGFETTKSNVFVVGIGKPEVTIPEVSAI